MKRGKQQDRERKVTDIPWAQLQREKLLCVCFSFPQCLSITNFRPANILPSERKRATESLPTSTLHPSIIHPRVILYCAKLIQKKRLHSLTQYMKQNKLAISVLSCLNRLDVFFLCAIIYFLRIFP